MAEPTQSSQPAPSPDALQHFELGRAKKNQGDKDGALTEFRRAAIADPAFVPAQLEIGFLCKEKARTDPVFNHHVFNAFRSAARSDLGNQTAHDEYILAGQKMRVLDELRGEYEAWSRQHPDNDLLKRCYKNIVALSLAAIPDRVDVGDGSGAGKVRKYVLFASLFLLLIGIAMIVLPFIFKGKIGQEQIPGMVKLGLFVIAVGVAGLVVRTRL